jgi:tRNA(Arg) A34 adenosine deaminase TadA
MWNQIELPWQYCFEEAWESYCNGSIPIGSVLVNHLGEIVSRGRNRINEVFAPGKQTCSNRLAHAEINVLLQLDSIESQKLKDCILFTTTEPCVLCFGAIVMAGVRKVRYAATDPVAGGANLNFSENNFIKSKNIDIQCDQKLLGNLQRVLRADYVLRNLSSAEADRFLDQYSIDYPEAIELGKKWFKDHILSTAMKNKKHISEIINDIYKELDV